MAILSAVAYLRLIDRLPGGFRNRVFRLVGIGVSAGAGAAATLREWILVAPAAATCGHRLALLQAGVAATSHSGGHVMAAVVNRGRRRRRCRRRDKCRRE